MRHFRWTRSRYRELLGGHASFTLKGRTPHVYRAEGNLAFYRAQPEAAAPQMVAELLKDLGYDRFNCPYILVSVLMNTEDGFPGGGGRPINGGFNTGGGIVILSSFGLDHAPNFQSTLQHELGHAFGLAHVDAYGYDMATSESLMSYNAAHHTKGFEPSQTPGVFIPEDLRSLALNQRVFPGFHFDPAKDVPPGYDLAPETGYPPMNIPGQPAAG
jgi:hypothetical protein